MPLDCGAARGALLPRRQPDEPHDAAMRLTANDRELAEVAIERDEHATPGCCARENLGVARILGPVTSPLHVVAIRREFGEHDARNAGVQQDLHGVRTG